MLFQESAKKIEIVKQVQSIVINSERLVCFQGRVGGANAGRAGGRGEGKEREIRRVTAILANQ